MPALERRADCYRFWARSEYLLWWVKNGTIPSVEDGVARLERLRAEGPVPDAFTLAKPFPPPVAPRSAPSAVET